MAENRRAPECDVQTTWARTGRGRKEGNRVRCARRRRDRLKRAIVIVE